MELFAFDDDYVRRLREGDRWTEEHFRSYFYGILFLKLYRRVRAEDLDDYRQDILYRVLRAVREKGEPEDGRKLGAYVVSVSNNYVIERYRTEGRTDQLDETVHQPVVEPGVVERLISEETVERVRRTIARLTPRDAQILRDVLSERDKDEICREMGVDREYLRVLVHRAKERFKSEYAGNVEPIRTKSRPPKPLGETKSPDPPLQR